MFSDSFFVNKGPHLIVSQYLNLLDLMRSPEAVEEVDEGDTRFVGCRLGDQSEVMGFLNRSGAQKRKAGASSSHHVAVVSKDRQRVRGHGTGRDMEHSRQEFSCDLEHVGDHEEQALGSGKGGCHRTGLKSSMDSAGGASFALHLNHLRDGSPDISNPFG